MDYKQRLQAVRDFGPRRPILRHVLLCLVLWDTGEDRLVYGGRLEHETGYTDRAIRRALRELVECGWLQPEKPARDGLDSKNQYGEAPRARVHGHTGGCLPGGVGHKTRYFVTYRSSPCQEPKRGRNVAKGERGSPIQGGTGVRSDPPIVPGRGNGGPEKGERGSEQGGTAFPRLDIEREIEREMAGGYPPLPPGEVVAPDTSPAPDDPDRGGLPLAAAGAADCPQGSLLGPDGPEGRPSQEGQGGLRQAKRLRQCWADVVQRMRSHHPEVTAIRLWLDTPKVEPVEIRGTILYVRVPSPVWARNLDRFSGPLAAIVSGLVSPVSTIVYQPKEAA